MERFSGAVTVIGAGYVGLTSAVCLAELGHRVACVDIDEGRIARLREDRVDLLEPGLRELLRRNRLGGRLSFHTLPSFVVPASDDVFVCVPTPGNPDGSTDMSAVDTVARRLAGLLRPGARLVVKSTVPPGTHRRIAALLGRPDVSVVSNPEFLREGSAIADFLEPDRIVIGADDPDAAARVARLYAGIDAEVMLTDATSAETIKYAANSFLAVKLAYANSIAELCERVGADASDVLDAMGRDPRIGSEYLRPGPGWGGPCLPKDARALAALGTTTGTDLSLVAAAVAANTHHQRRVATLVMDLLDRTLPGRRIGVLGLTFKAGTNDLRDSPALPITTLLARHAHVTAYDPAITVPVPGVTDHLTLAPDAESAVAGSDAVVLLTDWPEFTALPWLRLAQAMRGDLVVDTRNVLDADALADAGLRLRVLGRAAPVAEPVAAFGAR